MFVKSKFEVFLLVMTLSMRFGICQLPLEAINLPILIEFPEKQLSGSGFLLMDSQGFYFVTARHVLGQLIPNPINGKDSTYVLYEKSVKIFYYSRNSDVEDKKELEIDLEGLYNSGQLAFLYNEDIVVGRIGYPEFNGNFGQVVYNEFVKKPGKSALINHAIPDQLIFYNQVKIGADIFIFGYPKALGIKEYGQYDFNRPLVRRGIVSGKNIKRHTIIIDSPVYPGNSGGPVLQTKDGGFQLIGIVVEYIPEVTEWVNTKYGISNAEISNSGYSVVIPADYIAQLIDAIIKVNQLK